MMFDALRISARHVGSHAKGLEKSNHRAMPVFGLRGEAPSRLGKKNWAVWLRRDQAFPLKALHSAYDSHVADAQRFRKVRRPCFSEGDDEIGDGLDIVLGAFLRVLLPRSMLVRGGFPGASLRLAPLHQRFAVLLPTSRHASIACMEIRG